MVQVEHSAQGYRLVLTPNASLGWRGNLLALSLLIGVSALIGLGMWLAGAWVILPFAGLELTILAVALYITTWRCQRQEVLSIGADTVQLEKGVYRREAEWRLPRAYVWVEVGQPRHPWTPPALYLRHRDTDIALAPFLNLEDNRYLQQLLRQQGLRFQHRPPG